MDAQSVVESIARYHISLGWPGIGYSFFISKEGTIFQTHDLETMSYNVASRNQECLGICLEGDFSNRAPRPTQWASAKRLIQWLLGNDLPGREVVGHRDIALPSSPTACPGRLMEYWP